MILEQLLRMVDWRKVEKNRLESQQEARRMLKSRTHGFGLEEMQIMEETPDPLLHSLSEMYTVQGFSDMLTSLNPEFLERTHLHSHLSQKFGADISYKSSPGSHMISVSAGDEHIGWISANDYGPMVEYRGPLEHGGKTKSLMVRGGKRDDFNDFRFNDLFEIVKFNYTLQALSANSTEATQSKIMHRVFEALSAATMHAETPSQHPIHPGKTGFIDYLKCLADTLKNPALFARFVDIAEPFLVSPESMAAATASMAVAAKSGAPEVVEKYLEIFARDDIVEALTPEQPVNLAEEPRSFVSLEPKIRSELLDMASAGLALSKVSPQLAAGFMEWSLPFPDSNSEYHEITNAAIAAAGKEEPEEMVRGFMDYIDLLDSTRFWLRLRKCGWETVRRSSIAGCQGPDEIKAMCNIYLAMGSSEEVMRTVGLLDKYDEPKAPRNELYRAMAKHLVIGNPAKEEVAAKADFFASPEFEERVKRMKEQYHSFASTNCAPQMVSAASHVFKVGGKNLALRFMDNAMPYIATEYLGKIGVKVIVGPKEKKDMQETVDGFLDFLSTDAAVGCLRRLSPGLARESIEQMEEIYKAAETRQSAEAAIISFDRFYSTEVSTNKLYHGFFKSMATAAECKRDVPEYTSFLSSPEFAAAIDELREKLPNIYSFQHAAEFASEVMNLVSHAGRDSALEFTRLTQHCGDFGSVYPSVGQIIHGAALGGFTARRSLAMGERSAGRAMGFFTDERVLGLMRNERDDIKEWLVHIYLYNGAQEEGTLKALDALAKFRNPSSRRERDDDMLYYGLFESLKHQAVQRSEVAQGLVDFIASPEFEGRIAVIREYFTGTDCCPLYSMKSADHLAKGACAVFSEAGKESAVRFMDMSLAYLCPDLEIEKIYAEKPELFGPEGSESKGFMKLKLDVQATTGHVLTDDQAAFYDEIVLGIVEAARRGSEEEPKEDIGEIVQFFADPRVIREVRRPKKDPYTRPVEKLRKAIKAGGKENTARMLAGFGRFYDPNYSKNHFYHGLARNIDILFGGKFSGIGTSYDMESYVSFLESDEFMQKVEALKQHADELKAEKLKREAAEKDGKPKEKQEGCTFYDMDSAGFTAVTLQHLAGLRDREISLNFMDTARKYLRLPIAFNSTCGTIDRISKDDNRSINERKSDISGLLKFHNNDSVWEAASRFIRPKAEAMCEFYLAVGEETALRAIDVAEKFCYGGPDEIMHILYDSLTDAMFLVNDTMPKARADSFAGFVDSDEFAARIDSIRAVCPRFADDAAISGMGMTLRALLENEGEDAAFDFMDMTAKYFDETRFEKDPHKEEKTLELSKTYEKAAEAVKDASVFAATESKKAKPDEKYNPDAPRELIKLLSDARVIRAAEEGLISENFVDIQNAFAMTTDRQLCLDAFDRFRQFEGISCEDEDCSSPYEDMWRHFATYSASEDTDSVRAFMEYISTGKCAEVIKMIPDIAGRLLGNLEEEVCNKQAGRASKADETVEFFHSLAERVPNVGLRNSLGDAVFEDRGYLHLIKKCENEIKLSDDPKIAKRLQKLFDMRGDLALTVFFIDHASNRKFRNLYERLDYIVLGAGLIKRNLGKYLTTLQQKGVDGLTDHLAARIRERARAGPDAHVEFYTPIGFVTSAVKVMDEEDGNVWHMFEKMFEHGSVRRFLEEDEYSSKTIEIMKSQGYDTDFYVASGEEVLQRAGETGEISKWEDGFKSLVVSILGTKNTRPKVSIPGLSPKKAYHAIKHDYQKGVLGDQEAAKKVMGYFIGELEQRKEKAKQLEQRLAEIEEKGKEKPNEAKKLRKKLSAHNASKRKMEEIHDNVSGVIGQIDYGIRSKGGTITARMTKRNIPECFYDNHRLSCCIFKPGGASSDEIPLLLMDPQTTLLEYWIEGAEEFMGTATLYAGKDNTILMDTWEANSMVYSVLGNDMTKKFVLDSIVLAADKALTDSSKPKKVVIYNCTYGKPLEFVTYVRGLEQGSGAITYHEEFEFEAADVEDHALNGPQGQAHHYTDAFEALEHNNKMKGTLSAYVVDIGKYKEEMMREND